MVPMRVLMIVSLSGAIVFAQSSANLPVPVGCLRPVLVESKPLTIGVKELAWAKRVDDNGFKEILEGGTAETDFILTPRGLAGRCSGTAPNDSFFVYAPSGAKSPFLNEKLSENLSQWKWKAAICSGALLRTLPRNVWVPDNGFDPSGQYAVAILLHIRYTFQKGEDQQYTVKVADVSFTPGCKEISLMLFEFRGAYRTVEYPGPTLACKGENVYEYIPQKKQ